MKKFNLLFLLLISFNFLFSQKNEKKEIHFKIIEKKEIKTSSVKINFNFSGKTFDSIFYKNISNFYLNIKVNNFFYKKLKIKNPSGSFTLNGITPGSDILIESFCDFSYLADSLGGDYLILDTLIKSNEIRFIHIENPKKVSFGKKDNIEDNYYFISNGASVDKNGEFIGAYVVNGLLKKDIKENGVGMWFFGNGIIGFSNSIPLFFSGFDRYQNIINYYNSGLYIKDGKVVYKKEKRIVSVSWFIQDGPILIKNKENKCKKYKKEKKPRSAIGFSSNHYMFYIFSLKPITLFDFSEELLKRKIDGALLLEGAGYKDKYGEYGKLKKKNMNIIFYKK